MGDELLVVLFFAAVRRRHRQLSQCLHSPAAGRAIGGPPAVALSQVRQPVCAGTTTSRFSPGSSFGGAAATAGIRSRIQYPLIELATALIWAWMATGATGTSSSRFAGALFLTILLGIAMTDAREYIIPDEFSIGGLVSGWC